MKSEITIYRTNKAPLRFYGELIARGGDSEDIACEFGIEVYKTRGGKYVAHVRQCDRYDDPLMYALTADSLEELAKRLQDHDLMQIENCNEVVIELLHQLFPDDPSYVEAID
jgi:hypothetical protein